MTVNHFKIEYLDSTTDDDLEMRKNEKGVRWLLLRQSFEREGHQFRVIKLVKCKDSEELCTTDEEWMNLIDRGGLQRIKEFTCQFFHAVKDAV